MLEKHFTLDKKLPGPDHAFSMDPEELAVLCSSIAILQQQLGSSAIRYTESESLGRKDYRLSCVAKNKINKGETLSTEQIAFMRPGFGIPPKNINFLIGRQLKQSVEKGQVIELEMLS
jgi:sialic acid synthase SpsE